FLFCTLADPSLAVPKTTGFTSRSSRKKIEPEPNPIHCPGRFGIVDKAETVAAADPAGTIIPERPGRSY
ncbi:hypothetical protein GWI33_002213, partial [Rhynchophorus ferrugineus]